METQKLTSTRRFPVSAAWALLFTVVIALAVGASAPVAAQCQLVSGPTLFTCPGCSGNLNLRPISISRVYQNGTQDRIMIPLNYGHAVYSLANPASPQFLDLEDIRSPLPDGVGPINKDGQSFIAGTAASGDGQRALLTMDITGYGSTIVGKPSPNAFRPAGDTGTYRSGGLIIQKSGSRYIGYGFGGGSAWAADLTNPPPSFALGNMPSESAFSSLTTGTSYLQFTENLPGANTFQYLYWRSRTSVIVADASSPGPLGAITAAYPTWTILLSAWGRPAGDNLLFASAAVDPQSVTGNLFILGAFSSSSGAPGFSLLSFNPTTGLTTQAGVFAPDPSFSQQAGGLPALAAANSFSNDVDLYMWAVAPGPTVNGPKGTLRLYATSARVFGSPINQTVDFDMNITGVPQGVSGMDALRKSSTDVYAYLTDSTKVYAMQMSCQAGPAPAAGHLAVSNISGTPVQLSSGATVFVGDTLQITPSVAPPNAVYVVTNWDLDVDYHAGPETGTIGFLQLQYPDACFTGCAHSTSPSYPDPPQFTLIGPCDPQHNGGSLAPTTGCWNSVGPGGSGDFSSAQPAAGTTATLPIAFEAENALNTTTVPLATFNVTWKVPAVKVQNLAALLTLNGSNWQATFLSGSEGHPLSYAWYFGTDPAAPSPETLSPDVGCTGSSCTHTFAAGKGTYNAWLYASYAGGYSSPDWSSSPTFCYGGPCAFQVTVTDFVPAFTASSLVYIGGNPINVTNQSQMGTGITPSYFYYLCDATSGPCSDPDNPRTYPPTGYAPPLSGSGPWTIPVPSTPGTWWLRIVATYGSGPTTAQWQPNVNGVSDATAWPITVSNAPPTVTVAANPNPATAGSPVSFSYTTTGFPGTIAQNSWTFGDGGTSTAASPTHTYGGSGTYTVQCTVKDSLNNSATGIRVVQVNGGGGGPPPSNLSLSVSANPSSPAAGQMVTLTATASGGSGTYSSYTWHFGDGTVPASGPYASVTHTFTAAGTYYPQCTVVDSASATSTGSTTVTVGGGSGPGGPLAITVTANPSSTAVGISVTYTAVASGGSGTYTNYFWNFGDGQVAAGPYSTASHSYNVPGTYVGACTVTDSLAAYASGQATVTVAATTGPPDFRIAYPDGTDAVPGSDGSFLVVAGQQSIFRAVSAANPSQTLSVSNPYWNWGDGTTANVTPTAKTWYVGGTYPVSLIVTGQPIAYHNVNVVGGIPTAAYSFSYSVNGQAGGPVNANNVTPGVGILFTATGPPGAEYDWDFGDGTPVAPGPSVISHVFAASGSYTVVLTVKLGGNTFQTQTPTTFFVVEAPRWIVPGLAYTSGLVPGSFYVSDVVIENPSATEWAAYSVALLDGSNPPNWIALPAFQPLESRRISNILKKVFGKASGGPTFAMVVRGDTVPLDPAIWAFTYNNNAGDPTKGTYGVAIPAVPVSMAVGPGSPAASHVIPGLRDIPSAAYTNIGFVNTADVSATVNVSFLTHGTDGPTPLGNTLGIDIGPNQTKQFTQSLRQALAGTGLSYDTYTADGYYMSFDVVGDVAKVVPYAAVKDVASTDSIFLSPAPTVPGPVRVPSVVRLDSVTPERTDRFRSRIVVFNPSAQDRKVKLTYSYRRCPAGQACDNRLELALTPTLASGGTIFSDDFVKEFLSYFGITVNDTDSFIQSYLDVAPADTNTDPLIVRGETYNSQPTGNFGTQVPGLVPAVHGASAGGARTRLTIPYVVPKSGGSGYRTNVALVALGDAPAQATLRLHPPSLDSGYPAALDEVVIVDDKFFQLSLEKLFPELANFPANPGGYYSVEITVTSGTLAAFAVINDNVTSDGSLILAQPLP